MRGVCALETNRIRVGFSPPTEKFLSSTNRTTNGPATNVCESIDPEGRIMAKAPPLSPNLRLTYRCSRRSSNGLARYSWYAFSIRAVAGSRIVDFSEERPSTNWRGADRSSGLRASGRFTLMGLRVDFQCRIIRTW